MNKFYKIPGQFAVYKVITITTENHLKPDKKIN